MCKVIAAFTVATIVASAFCGIRVDFGRQTDTVGGVTADTHLSSGDHIVVGDLRYMVLSDSDWAYVTNRLDMAHRKLKMVLDYYGAMNSNESGRVALHGRRGHTTVTNGTITVEYADGYRHVESAWDNRVRRQARPVPKPVSLKAPDAPPSEMRRRIEELRRRRREARTRTNEVHVVIGGGR